MKKIIGVCGAHGTGKTTLINRLQAETQLPVFKSSSTAMWRKYKITDFEILPKQVRSVFQNIGVLEHIRLEDAFEADYFISDRTILDYLMYTVSSSELSGVDLDIHIALIKERIKIYYKFIFIKPDPSITEIASKETKFARAHIELQQKITQTALHYLALWEVPHIVIDVLDIDERVSRSLEYISS